MGLWTGIRGEPVAERGRARRNVRSDQRFAYGKIILNPVLNGWAGAALGSGPGDSSSGGRVHHIVITLKIPRFTQKSKRV